MRARRGRDCRDWICRRNAGRPGFLREQRRRLESSMMRGTVRSNYGRSDAARLKQVSDGLGTARKRENRAVQTTSLAGTDDAGRSSTGLVAWACEQQRRHGL